MKFIFSILCFFIFADPKIYAREVIVIGHRQQLDQAKRIKETLQNELGIPGSIIKIQSHPFPCFKRITPLMQICVTAEGEMKVIDIKNVLIETFGESLKEIDQ